MFKMGLWRNCKAMAAWVALAVVLPAQAQVVTPEAELDTDRLRRAPLQEAATEQAEPQLGTAPVQDREVVPGLDDRKVDISAFHIDGVDAALKAELQALVAGAVGPGKTYEDLVVVTQRLRRHLQDQAGYYLAHVFVPSQRMQQGVVRVQVQLGVLEGIELTHSTDSPVDESVVQAHLAQLQVGQVLRTPDLERMALLLNDLRGLSVRFALKAGQKPGGTVLQVRTQPDNTPMVRLSYDNFGSKRIGQDRVQASVLWSSPLGLGDALVFNHTSSLGNELQFSLLGYSMPWGTSGLRLGFSASQVDYTLQPGSGAVAPLGSVGPAGAPPASLSGVQQGESTSYRGHVSYPWIRSRNLNLYTWLGGEHRRLNDFLVQGREGVRKELDSAEGGVHGDWRDAWAGGGITTFEATARQSEVEYAEGKPAQVDDDSGTLKLMYNFSRLQNVVPGVWQVWGSLRGQEALNNLDSSEQCSLGGVEGVRAFVQGTGLADSCTVLTAELRHVVKDEVLPLPKGSRLTVGLFYDQGDARLRRNLGARPQNFANTLALSAYGVQLNWSLPKQWQAQLIWAEPLQEGPRPLDQETTRLVGRVRVAF